MKITNNGVRYDVVKLKGKRHSCYGCVAYKLPELCVLLQAHLYTRCRKSCQSKKVIFRPSLKQPKVCNHILRARIKQEREFNSILRNFVVYMAAIFPTLIKGEKLTVNQLTILHRYLRKLKGECKDA